MGTAAGVGKAERLAGDSPDERDPLTGLPTRRRFESWIAAAQREADSGQRRVAVLVLDLDRFGRINDSLGHAAGDQVLRSIAERIRPRLCACDIATRIGADRFAVGIAGLADEDEARSFAEDLRREVARPLSVRPVPSPASSENAGPDAAPPLEVVPTASIGIAVSLTSRGDSSELLRRADAAVGDAKAFGGDSVHVCERSDRPSPLARLSLEAELRGALRREELSLHFQPLVDAVSGEVFGCEALARWNHPQLGRVPPVTFIPIAEDTGLIEPIGRFVLRAACEQAAEWKRRGLPTHSVSVNVSPRQFWHEGFLACVVETLEETGVPPQQLVLEITESCLLRDLETTRSTLEALVRIGVRVSIDDFGTGYSSFSVLRELPLDTLKVDRSFVAPALEEPSAALIVSTMISLGSGLGLDVIAEGVETPEQRDFLLEVGCPKMQGYHFSPPLDAEAFTELLARGATLPPEKADQDLP